MLEPELDALREEGLNDTTKRRLPRNRLARTAGFSGRDASKTGMETHLWTEFLGLAKQS